VVWPIFKKIKKKNFNSNFKNVFFQNWKFSLMHKWIFS
jgi:hypothetical protein